LIGHDLFTIKPLPTFDSTATEAVQSSTPPLITRISTEDMTKTYHGSCICGAVKFEADIDFSKGTGKCNCTICRKLRFWSIHIKPEEFRLVSDTSSEANEAELTTDYIYRSPAIHQLFCKKCGVHAYHRGDIPEIGGAFVSVNVACIDDIEHEELAELKVRYADGLNNNWRNEPKVKTYL